MTDLELLEAAAKAAGLPWDQWVIDGDDSWNPLDDDGDALRLAVKLDLHIRFYRKHVDVDAEVHGKGVISEHFTTLKDAATRRAIVRAAAEVGRSTK